MGYSPQRAEEIWASYTLVILWNCIVSIAAGILTIIIMVRLKVYLNRMMAIVFSMTILQCLYDISLIPQLSAWCGPNGSNEYTKCRTIQVSANLAFGTSSAQCTCLITALIAFVILKRKSVSLNRYWMFTLVALPGLAMGIVEGLAYYDAGTHNAATESASDLVSDQLWSSNVLAFYDSLRLAQIAFNTFCMLLILWELRSIKIICVKGSSDSRSAAMSSASAAAAAAAAVGGDSNSSGASQVSRHAFPMFLLASRLIWYPFAQSISRIGPAWYHFATGDASSSYRKYVVKSDSPEMTTIELYAYALTTPLAGLLYFGIFLMMQRGAWTEAKLLLTCGWGGCSQQAVANKSASASEKAAKRRSTRIASAKLKSMRSLDSFGDLYDTSSSPSPFDVDTDGGDVDECDYDYEYGASSGEDYSRDSESLGGLPLNEDVLAAGGANKSRTVGIPSARHTSLAVSRASLTDYKADRTSLFGQRSGKSNVDALLEAPKHDVTNDLMSYLDEDELCDLISRQSQQDNGGNGASAGGERRRDVQVLAVQSNPVVSAAGMEESRL